MDDTGKPVDWLTKPRIRQGIKLYVSIFLIHKIQIKKMFRANIVNFRLFPRNAVLLKTFMFGFRLVFILILNLIFELSELFTWLFVLKKRLKKHCLTVTLKFNWVLVYWTKCQRELEIELGVVNLASPVTYLKDMPILVIA